MAYGLVVAALIVVFDRLGHDGSWVVTLIAAVSIGVISAFLS